MSKATILRELLKKLNKSFGLAIANELSEYGITLPQLLVLRRISDGPKTIGDISKSISLSYSTVSGIIDRLERENLVKRIRDKDDRRVVWIQKTEKVEEIKRKAPVFQESYYASLFEGLTEEEMDQIIQSLELLTKILEKKVEEKA
ncbi:MarR family winged helix-turn-helix transcriptional regulator [Ammoniphilus sp. YIM 78166]|uniref:MarR family winged helix-turn-helix transcriptional regulator n=1 Tax=Ammoniphilus sp. YIM 78166 TaxID=1644106 RepID=UPI00106F96E2|nr:MarR family transcriptional regulator [Ammoniphilus sp. YIM 78166]